jgi:hypothetical protein
MYSGMIYAWRIAQDSIFCFHRIFIKPPRPFLRLFPTVEGIPVSHDA